MEITVYLVFLRARCRVDFVCCFAEEGSFAQNVSQEPKYAIRMRGRFDREYTNYYSGSSNTINTCTAFLHEGLCMHSCVETRVLASA